MNFKLILKLISNVLKAQAILFLFPFAVSLIYGEDARVFLITAVLSAVCGMALTLIKPTDKKFKIKDAFFAAALSWIVVSLFGALPFWFCGGFESGFKNFADCVFESVSGFTTTGATILSDIESLPKGIIFWRGFSHWVGGMGVLMIMLAVLPTVNASSMNLMRVESTGPSPNKVVPKIKDTARVMYLIYGVMSAVLLILLLVTGLPLFDAFMHMFSVAGTGGFSNMNASEGAYGNLPAEIIMSVFMFLFGINFTLYYYLINRRFKQFFADGELRLYFGIVAASIIIITVNITGLCGSVGEALRHSSFQVVSVISTTGFSTMDFNLWPELSKSILVFLMFTGCCAGSTGGGVKIVRLLLLFKVIRNEIKKIIYPKSVEAITLNGRRAESEIISRAALFFFVYFMFFFAAIILISADGNNFTVNSTAVISTLGNNGPGLDIIGPAGNYGGFSSFSKIVLSVCMLAGRLEFFPLMILFNPLAWKKS